MTMKEKSTGPLEEALGSKEAISLLAEQVGDTVAYLLATEDHHLKGDLIVLRLAVRPAFQRSRIWCDSDRCFKRCSCSKGKGKPFGSIVQEDLLSLLCPARISEMKLSLIGVSIWFGNDRKSK